MYLDARMERPPAIPMLNDDTNMSSNFAHGASLLRLIGSGVGPTNEFHAFLY